MQVEEYYLLFVLILVIVGGFHVASLSDGMTYNRYDGSFTIYPILVIGNIAYIGFTEAYLDQKVWIYTFDISTGTPTKLQSLLLRGADSPGSLYSMGLEQVDENHLLALTYGNTEVGDLLPKRRKCMNSTERAGLQQLEYPLSKP